MPSKLDPLKSVESLTPLLGGVHSCKNRIFILLFLFLFFGGGVHSSSRGVKATLGRRALSSPGNELRQPNRSKPTGTALPTQVSTCGVRGKSSSNLSQLTHIAVFKPQALTRINGPGLLSHQLSDPLLPGQAQPDR